MPAQVTKVRVDMKCEKPQAALGGAGHELGFRYSATLINR
jgi:hypothetical protein